MSKLGYTWYPKDWGNSESVFELTLIERGLYRELIDMAMLNDNKTETNIKTWSRKFGSSVVEIERILITLEDLKLIELKDKFLFIPSCEPRLNLIRGGRNGGKKSKPSVKPIQKPIEILEENNQKPTSNQIEKKVNIKEKETEIKINNKPFVDVCLNSEQWLEVTCMQNKMKIELVKKYLNEFELFLITTGEQKKYIEDFKSHFINWLKKKPKEEQSTNKLPKRKIS